MNKEQLQAMADSIKAEGFANAFVDNNWETVTTKQFHMLRDRYVKYHNQLLEFVQKQAAKKGVEL